MLFSLNIAKMDTYFSVYREATNVKTCEKRMILESTCKLANCLYEYSGSRHVMSG